MDNMTAQEFAEWVENQEILLEHSGPFMYIPIANAIYYRHDSGTPHYHTFSFGTHRWIS